MAEFNLTYKHAPQGWKERVLRAVCRILGHREVGVAASWVQRSPDDDWWRHSLSDAGSVCVRCGATGVQVTFSSDQGYFWIDDLQIHRRTK